MKHFNKALKLIKTGGLLLTLGAFGWSAVAADMSQEPLFILKKMPPNVMFTLDNSGSMDSDYLSPSDTQYSDYRNYDVTYNGLAYNPAVYYEPPMTGTKAQSPALATPATVGTVAMASPQKVYDDGFSQTVYSNGQLTLSAQSDLAQTCKASSIPVDPPSTCATSGSKTFNRYAYYYSGSTRVEIKPSTTGDYTRGTNRVDCTKYAASSKCSGNEEFLNFANWWSYYRTRVNAAKSGVGLAFSSLDGTYRVGYGEINGGSVTVESAAGTNPAITNSTVKLGVRAFEDTTGKPYRTNWYYRLYQAVASGNTPTRRALKDVGSYFSNAKDNGPWGETPGSSGGTQYKCRKNFHIMMTDGYWNDGNSYSDTDDSTDGSFTYGGTTVKTYDAAAATNLYKNSACSGTMADIAMHYWKTDIRPDWNKITDKNVPVSDTDPAYWQHVSQYAVGFGVSGYKNYDNATAVLASLKANKETWYDSGCPSNLQKQNIDDLWHAAVNGRGQYFSAKDPKVFRDSLTTALQDIAKVTATASTEVASSSVVTSGTYQFTPSFTSNSWTGDLKAFPITDSAGTISTTASWAAADLLKAQTAASRNIVTWSGSVGILFDSSNVTALSADMVNFIRGDSSKEKANGGSYRDRTGKLGDIINSAPLYVGVGTDQGYGSLPTGGSSYKAFKTAKASRKAMLYVGANDGMMHGFRADTGAEVFAYVPKAVYDNLSVLSDVNYSVKHKYYVDGQMTEGDAYLSGAWSTVLLGSTGAGAKSVFAVNITDPGSTYGNLTKSSVMWEAGSEADMGYVLGDVRVAVLNNGVWVAVHGNGVHGSGKSVLYLRDLTTGSAYRTITMSADTGGLTTPALIYNKKGQMIGAYAGDLQGNLWKIDLSVPTTPVVTKMFAGSSSQPITQRPAYKEHPQGGYMVMFGTGKYFDTGDNSTSDLQGVYGIWDRSGMTVEAWPANTDSSLLPFTASTNLTPLTLSFAYDTDGTTVIGAKVATGTAPSGTVRGWHASLTLNSGERVVTTPLILDRTLIVKTLIPGASDGCSMGGESFLYGFNYLYGINTSSTKAFGTLDIVKLANGGTAGIQIVQTGDGKLQAWTKSFDSQKVPDKTPTDVVSPGFRSWRQLPIN